MAKDIRGLYQNNRRREAHAVTCSVPFVLEEADLREGKPAVTLTTGDYTTLTLPGNIIVKSVNLVVTDAELFDGAGSKVAVKIGTVSAVADTAVDAAGLTKGVTASFPMLITDPQDVNRYSYCSWYWY